MVTKKHSKPRKTPTESETPPQEKDIATQLIRVVDEVDHAKIHLGYASAFVDDLFGQAEVTDAGEALAGICLPRFARC